MHNRQSAYKQMLTVVTCGREWVSQWKGGKILDSHPDFATKWKVLDTKLDASLKWGDWSNAGEHLAGTVAVKCALLLHSAKLNV